MTSSYNDMTPADRTDVDRAYAVQQSRASIKRRMPRVRRLSTIIDKLTAEVERYDTTADYSEFQAVARTIDGARVARRLDEDAIRQDRRVLEET